MKRITGAALALSLSCLLFAGQAFAWQEAAQPETVRMDAVVVTAGRVEETQKTVPNSITVISREDIAKNQNRDLGGLLRNYGLQVNAYPPAGTVSQLAVRGMRTSLLGDDTDGTVLLLINGRRVGTDNISLVPLVNVERIEILRGPAAVQYGTSAVGGVVNIITRRGGDDVHGMVEAGLSSWEGYRTQAELSGSGYGMDASGGVSLAGQGTDYEDGRGDPYTNTDFNYNLAYSLNLGYTFMDEHRIGVSFLGVRADDAGSPGDTSWLTPDDRMDRSNQSVDFSYEGGDADAGLSWMARYFFGKNKYDMYTPGSPYASDTEYQGAQAQLTFSRGIFSLTGGADWLKYDSEVDSVWFPVRNSTYENKALFLLGKLNLFDERLTLSGGVRYDGYTLEVPGRDEDFHRTTPSFGIALNPFDWVTLRATYGESYRIPQPTAMLGFYDGMSTYLPNYDLDPERAKSWDAGVEFNVSSLTFGLTYFETRYKDKIASRSVSGDRQYYNIAGTSRYKGIELNAGYDLGELFDAPFQLRPYVMMTHLFTYDDPDGNAIQYVSNNDISYGINFNHPNWGLDIDLRVVYFGHQHVDDWSAGGDVKIGGDTTADIYLTKSLYTDERNTVSIKAEVRNIFDQYYEVVKNYPMPGRSFYVGFKWDF